MRTTVDLDDDVVAELAALRRRRDLGLSEAVNELIRQGLLPREGRAPFTQPTRPLGLTVDVTNVAETLAVLEGDEAR